jgi:hypothetical protein
VHTEFSWGNVRERELLKDLRVDGRIILKYIPRIIFLSIAYVSTPSHRTSALF